MTNIPPYNSHRHRIGVIVDPPCGAFDAPEAWERWLAEVRQWKSEDFHPLDDWNEFHAAWVAEAEEGLRFAREFASEFAAPAARQDASVAAH